MSERINTDSNNASNEMLQLQSNISFKITKIEKKLTDMEWKLENILKMLSTGTGNITEKSRAAKFMPVIGSDTEFKLIDSISELNDFEKKLKNSDFRKESVRFSRHPILIYFDFKLYIFLIHSFIT